MDFKTMEISFCKKSGNNIIEANDKQQIIDILSNKYSINFKTNRAMILNKKSLSFLRMNPHLISIKTTGSNYYLFLTRINDTQCAFFIDRKVKQGYSLPRIISVNLSFDDAVFDDTLIDGELIKDTNNNWMFLISDMNIYKGKKLTMNIVDRFNKIYECLETHFHEDPIMDICPLRVKRLFDYSEYSYLITQYMPRMNYNIRGLYFNTLNPKHCNQLFIYKESNTNNHRVQKKQINKDIYLKLIKNIKINNNLKETNQICRVFNNRIAHVNLDKDNYKDIIKELVNKKLLEGLVVMNCKCKLMLKFRSASTASCFHFIAYRSKMANMKIKE